MNTLTNEEDKGTQCPVLPALLIPRCASQKVVSLALHTCPALLLPGPGRQSPMPDRLQSLPISVLATQFSDASSALVSNELSCYLSAHSHTLAALDQDGQQWGADKSGPHTGYEHTEQGWPLGGGLPVQATSYRQAHAAQGRAELAPVHPLLREHGIEHPGLATRAQGGFAPAHAHQEVGPSIQTQYQLLMRRQQQLAMLRQQQQLSGPIPLPCKPVGMAFQNRGVIKHISPFAPQPSQPRHLFSLPEEVD
jgi:hypothetical protein